MKTTIARAAAGLAFAAAAVAGLAAPTAASAQGYYSYEQCQRDNNNRGVAGAAIGGIAGGVIGNQASANGRHTENTLLGAAIGAIGGALVGRGDTRCYTPAYDGPPPRDEAYERYYDDRSYDRSEYDRGEYAPREYDQREYADRYYEPRYVAPPPVYYAPPPVVYAAPPPVSLYFGFGGGNRYRGGYGYARRRGW